MDSAWKQAVAERVGETLSYIFPDNDALVAKFVSQDNIGTWYKAFVHETYDINENYEVLEYLGDRILKTVFPAMLVQKDPELTNAQLSNLDMFFMSKDRQGDMARDLLMITPLILTGANLPGYRGLPDDLTKVSVDVFESFFGALWVVGEKITPGIGYLACYNMITVLFVDEEFGDEINGSKKTQVIERLKQIGGEIQEREHEPSLGAYIVTLTFSDRTLDMLRAPRDFPQTIKVGPLSKSAAVKQAYAQALSALEGLGVTAAYANNVSHQKDFRGIDPRLVGDVMRAAADDGFPRLDFRTFKKLDTEAYYVHALVGENSDGVKKILATGRVTKSAGGAKQPMKTPEARAALMELYLSSRPPARSSSSNPKFGSRSRK